LKGVSGRKQGKRSTRPAQPGQIRSVDKKNTPTPNHRSRSLLTRHRASFVWSIAFPQSLFTRHRGESVWSSAPRAPDRGGCLAFGVPRSRGRLTRASLLPGRGSSHAPVWHLARSANRRDPYWAGPSRALAIGRRLSVPWRA
jgi:hypothetical protein